MQSRALLIVGFIFTLGLTACGQKTESPATATPLASAPTQTAPASITSLEILKLAATPPEYRVVARGQLPDGCARLQSPTVERDGFNFKVALLSNWISQASCPPGPIDFERVIPLDVMGLEPGNYSVTVNSVGAAFALEGVAVAQATPVPTMVAPTPTPESTSAPPTPTLMPTVAPTAAASRAGCVDKLAFFADVTVPDDTLFQQGEKFVKTWRLRNEGNCALDNRFSFVFGGGDQMSGPLSQSLTEEVPAGGLFDISVNLTAPARGGAHVGNWQFQNPEGKHFGVGVAGADYVWVKIQVGYGSGSGGTGGGPTAATGCAQRDTGYEAEVLTLVNNARAANGLPALTLQPQLTAAALAHSTDMACNDFVDHTGSDGSTWTTRIAAQGYAFSNAKENMYVGNPAFGGTPAGAMEWWMSSGIHRGNILSSDISSIGVAYVFGPSSTYGGYYTLVFTRP